LVPTLNSPCKKQRMKASFLASVLLLFLLPFGVSAANPLAPELAPKGCDIFDDAQGVPHLRADNELTAFACLGFVHARDRLWEMDYFRRTAQGRRSEILGSSEIRSDFTMRILGLPKRAKLIFRGMAPDQQRPLWAYTFGVNQFLEGAGAEAYEFKKLGYKPDSWSPEDTISLTLLQSFDQTRKTFGTQLQEQEWRTRYGDVPAVFKNDELPWDSSILKNGEYPASSAVAVPEKGSHDAVRSIPDSLLDSLRNLAPGETFESAVGSNNWVIAPSRSLSGNSWVANDPHLKLHYPAVWHWAHIQGGELDVIGAAFPGIPAFVSGANRKTSWGLTNAYLNVSSIALVDESEVKGASAERPVIWFRFGFLKLPFIFKTFEKVAGSFPVLPVPSPAGKVFVLNWSGFELDSKRVSESFEGLTRLMVAQSAAAADQALQQISLPTWNFVFADTQGKIGYRAVGLIPRPRTLGASQLGIPEIRLADWQQHMSEKSWFSSAEMPHVFDPARGYVVTANNRQWPVDSAFHGGRSYQHGFRAFRIEELLLKSVKHDFETLRKIQCDVQATDARFLVPLLLKAVSESRGGSAQIAEAMAVLGSWDFEASLDCRACALYRRWMSRLKDGTKLNESAIYRKLQKLEPVFQQLLGTELLNAASDLNSSAQSIQPRWGEVHLNRFPHLMGESWFGSEMIPTPGDDHSVNPGSSKWENGRFYHKTGASERLLVEMSNPPTVYSVLPGTNRDLEKRNLADPEGPWMDWVSCRLQKRQFPLDWAQVPFSRQAFR